MLHSRQAGASIPLQAAAEHTTMQHVACTSSPTTGHVLPECSAATAPARMASCWSCWSCLLQGMIRVVSLRGPRLGGGQAPQQLPQRAVGVGGGLRDLLAQIRRRAPCAGEVQAGAGVLDLGLFQLPPAELRMLGVSDQPRLQAGCLAYL